jgi:acyl-CoA reductase-like NAD-dependent aldehyde dehydrogenase
VLSHRDLAGVHFTGSTNVFNNMWKTIGENMARYRSYPRIVGETGGKDFIVAHPSADPAATSTARRATSSRQRWSRRKTRPTSCSAKRSSDRC